jgi:hypothetical protein
VDGESQSSASSRSFVCRNTEAPRQTRALECCSGRAVADMPSHMCDDIEAPAVDPHAAAPLRLGQLAHHVKRGPRSAELSSAQPCCFSNEPRPTRHAPFTSRQGVGPTMLASTTTKWAACQPAPRAVLAKNLIWSSAVIVLDTTPAAAAAGAVASSSPQSPRPRTAPASSKPCRRSAARVSRSCSSTPASATVTSLDDDVGTCAGRLLLLVMARTPPTASYYGLLTHSSHPEGCRSSCRLADRLFRTKSTKLSATRRGNGRDGHDTDKASNG